MRFASIPFEETNAEYPSVELTGELPQLTVDNIVLGSNDIFQYLKEKVCDLDKNFSKTSKNEITLYSYLIRVYANSIFSSYKWSSNKEAYKFVKPVYDSVLSFPYNYSYYREKQNRAKSAAGVILPLQRKDQLEVLDNLYKIMVEKLHQHISSLPEDKPCFLFGEQPSSLDAVLFAHLAQIMEFPSELQSHLLTFPTLVSFYESIMKRYFSAARGEATSDNMFVNRYGMRISCRPTENIEAVLPYRVTKFDYELNESEDSKEAKGQVDPVKKLEQRYNFVLFMIFGVATMAFSMGSVLLSI